MNELAKHHLSLGARLAGDQIPLEYGDQEAEYSAALQAAILLDRSHEGRILLTGRDRLNLVNRMSTNDVAALKPCESCATIFTNANARILFRALCLSLPRGLLLISEAGQGPALASFLRRSIFFGDKAHVQDISADTAQFAIHGPQADAIIEALDVNAEAMPAMSSVDISADGRELTLARRKAICGPHWAVICKSDVAASVHQLLLQAGADLGIAPAGSLTYNILRIRSGRPAGLELSADYLPLEVGLWDEVSFSKGCYTGQEIIARMESRQRLARALVKLELSALVAAPATVSVDGKPAGRLTSSVKAADGEIFALAVLRLSHARPGQELQVGDAGIPAHVTALAGSQAPFVLEAAAPA